MAQRHGLILFAHGARDPEWARPFADIQQRVAAAMPEVPVLLAFLESMAPDLAQAVAALVQQNAARITIVPLFMAQGGHLKGDLARLVTGLKREYPQLEITISPAIGEVELIRMEIARWVVETNAPGIASRNPKHC